LNGKRASEEALFNRYKEIVKNYIEFKYPKNNEIDDDVSEIMIKIFTNLADFDSKKSKFKSWAISITKNHMIDRWRSNNTSITFANQDLRYGTSDTLFGIDLGKNGEYTVNAEIKFENDNTITFLSSQLSPVDFTMLNMKYNQGYNYTEIGKHFNVTSSTASNRVNYIKTKLKKENPELILK